MCGDGPRVQAGIPPLSPPASGGAPPRLANRLTARDGPVGAVFLQRSESSRPTLTLRDRG
jgi:hypothetical protein